MKDFLFFHPDPSYLYNPSSQEVEAERQLLIQERSFLSTVRETIQSGAGLSRILHHREKADLVFITAFLGDASKNKNRENNKELSQEIQALGFGFIQVEGTYKTSTEESYCVINYAEDTEFFTTCLSELANKYGQDSILVVPKGEPAYLIYHNGSKELIGMDLQVITKSVESYTSIKGHDFRFKPVSGYRHPARGDSLVPFRQGNSIQIPIASRHNLLQERNTNFLVKLMR